MERSSYMLRVSATLQLAAIALALAAAHARAADGASQAGIIAQCWTAEQLRQRPEEIRPQRSLAGAPVPVPRQSLAPHGREAPGAVRRVELPPGSRKLIALTFDLCETPGEIAGYDGPIFDYLRANAVKATMFAGGKWMLTHDERGQRTRQLMADPLFEVANHGWSHQNLRLLQGAALEREIEGPQAAYQAVRARLAREQCIGVPRSMSAIPERMRLMRFPFGACNPESLQAVADAGLIPIQWDISTGDPSPGTSAAAIVAEMLRARPARSSSRTPTAAASTPPKPCRSRFPS